MRCLRSLGLCSLALTLGALFAAGAPTAADPPADELLARVRATASTLRTFTADVDRISIRGYDAVGKKIQVEQTGTLEVERPNRLRLELRDKDGPRRFLEIWDGHTKWQFGEPGNYYWQSALPADTIAYFPGIGWPGYAEPSYEDLLGDAERTIRSLGKQTVDDRVYDVMEMTGQLQTVRWYVGPDNRVYRHEETSKRYSFSDPETLVLSNIQEGIPISDTDFVFHPESARKGIFTIAHPNLIPVGHAAPTLALPLANGGSVRLADLYRGKKALLVFSINYPS